MTPRNPEPRTPQSLDEELLEAETAAIIATETDETRVARVVAELEDGFAALAHVGRAVSVFGSARTPEDHPEYAVARKVSRMLGEAGFAIITGGGPGIMEAANRGASEAAALSVGLDIDLQWEGMNRWVELPLRFHYFFTRKVMFVRYASAFVVFPGGYGTLDEAFEALTLIQTDKIHSFPVILVGSEYWSGLVEWLRDRVLAEGKIAPADLDRFELTDDPQKALRIVSAAKHRAPRALRARRPRPAA